jgi:beta-N-acetylhexosaminidase
MRLGSLFLLVCILANAVCAADEESEFILREYAAQLARSMDDKTLAAQTILTGIDGDGVLKDDMKALLKRVPAGGLMLFKYNLTAPKSLTASFLAAAGEAASSSASLNGGGVNIPPFIAVDHEGGQVHRFGEGLRRLPSPLSYWEMARARGWDTALAYVEAGARISGRELRSLGITMNLAPVAETLTEENRAFLGARSYGPDPAFVEKAAAAFIRGMAGVRPQAGGGISCVVKHFPGNTGTDPHTEALSLNAGREELERMTAPMAALIRSGVPAIMVSHALVPSWDPDAIASLSPRIIGSRLRGELGFKGIVLADDFSMAAAGGAAVRPQAAGQQAALALTAGVDMVMAWPGNLRSVHAAILEALRQGRLSRERLEEAAGRIIYEKLRLGLITL